MNIPTPMKMYRYRYWPTDVVLDIDGEEIKFKEGAITYINIIHQFTTRHLPVVKCGLQCEIRVIRKIYDKINKAKITFCIMEDKLTDDEEIVDTTEYLRHTFSIIPVHEKTVYITSDQIYDESKSQEQSGEEDKEGEVETLRTYQIFEMYLIDLDAINKFDQEYSDHLTDVSYEGIIQKIFMERDIQPDKSFGTPPLQKGKLKDVIIPLGDMIENITEMNTKYGFYDSNPILYYDFEWWYCLNKIKPDIEYPSKTEFGTVTFILLNPEKPDREVTGSYDDAEHEIHWVNIQKDPADFDKSIRDVNAKMSTLTSVNRLGEVNKTTLDEEATRMRYIYAMNDLTESQVMNEMMHGSTRAIAMQNVCAKFFKPYKDYTFEVDTSYESLNLTGHIYRILSFVMDIQRIGNTGYLTTETAIIYNPEREEE